MSEAHRAGDAGDVLDRRAAELARVERTDRERSVDSTVAVVAIGGEKVGIPVSALREIIRTPALSPLPGLPAWLPGIVQARGEIIGAVDLARLLGRGPSEEARFMAVLEGAAGPLGLLLEEVVGFRDVHVDEITERLGAGRDAGERPIRAVTKDLVALLDVERLLADERIVVDQAGESRSERGAAPA